MDYQVKDIRGGFAGTDETVATMMQLIEDSLQDPVVVQTARNIVRYTPERDKDAEAYAIREWILSHYRYCNEGIETISAPRMLIDEINQYGNFTADCDDVTVLGAALQRALGHTIRIRVVSQRPDKYFSHVFYEYLSPKYGWVGMDLIMRKKPFGWEATSVTNEKTYDQLGALGGSMDVFQQTIQANPFSTGGAQAFPSAKAIYPSAKQVFTRPSRAIANRMNSFALPKKNYFGAPAKELMTAPAGTQKFDLTANWFGTGESGSTWASSLQGPSEFYEKSGGALTVSPIGRIGAIGNREEEMGQIIEAATTVLPKVFKFLKKAKAAKGGGGAAPPPPSCPPGSHVVDGLGALGKQCVKDVTTEDYLLYGGLAAAALGGIWYFFLRKKR